MVKVAVVGASGYTGSEVLRLLSSHPGVKVTAITSRQEAGKPLAEIMPSLAGAFDLVFVQPDDSSVMEADFVLTALPHHAAMEAVGRFVAAGRRVIDFSADFRFRDPAVYEKLYGPHSHPDLTRRAVYGLPEIHREAIKKADLVAEPGCYPTSAILPLAPLLKAGLVEAEGIIIDAKSGVSGAGRTPAVGNLLSEAGEDFKAYKVASHRHQPEIEQELSLAAGRTVRTVFVPHLVPMSRGMLSTIYVRPRAGLKEILDCWQEKYAQEPFVQIFPASNPPRTIAVRGSNCCHLSAALDKATGTAILLSAIDNLTKGASGQVVQCLNLMAGFEEIAGLPRVGLYP